MKIAGIVLALLMVVGAALIAMIGTDKSFKLADDLAELEAEVGGAGALETLAATADTRVPSSGRLQAGGGIMAIGGLAGLVLLIGIFARKSAVKVLSAAAVGLSAIAIVVLPYVETGELSGFAPRTHAIIVTVLMLVAAGGAHLATRRRDREGPATA